MLSKIQESYEDKGHDDFALDPEQHNVSFAVDLGVDLRELRPQSQSRSKTAKKPRLLTLKCHCKRGKGTACHSMCRQSLLQSRSKS